MTRFSGVLAMGRHRDGTVYLMDKPWTEERVFSSDGPGRVYRRRPLAWKSGSAPATYLYATDGPGQPFLLKVELFGNPSPKMGVLRGPSTARDFAIGSEGDELEIIGDSGAPLAGVEFRDLPAASIVLYLAKLEDGRHVAVLRPENQTTSEVFRVFLGPTSAMVERPIRSIRATDSNHAWLIELTLDGAAAQVILPVMGGAGPLEARCREVAANPAPARRRASQPSVRVSLDGDRQQADGPVGADGHLDHEEREANVHRSDRQRGQVHRRLQEAGREEHVGQRIRDLRMPRDHRHQHQPAEDRQPLEAVGVRPGQALHERREVRVVGNELAGRFGPLQHERTADHLHHDEQQQRPGDERGEGDERGSHAAA